MTICIYDSEDQTFVDCNGETVPFFSGSEDATEIVVILEGYKHGSYSLQEAYTILSMMIEKGSPEL